MTSFLSVVEPGLAASVQDFGRRGYQRFGVPMSGAVDPVSLTVANILVGNPPGEAALEVLAAGLVLRVCAHSAMVAVTGAAAPFVLETPQSTLKIPPCQSAVARRGDVLRFRPPKDGAAFYIAVAGGFDLPAVFGSRSTYRRAKLGGYLGRALLAGDELSLRFSAAPELEPRLLDVGLGAPSVLRVMRGPNAEYFAPCAFETLFASAYTVAPASDRMGLRLQGPPLERAIEGELPSQGTTAGAMQAPPDGQPILLLADRQTTGGYPCIATVIGADVPAAGRLAAGMRVHFEEVNRDKAVALLKAQNEWLATLPAHLKPVSDYGLSTERLLSANLIGGVTAGGAEEE